MDNYKPNSHKSKDDVNKKIDKVISGDVITKKRSVVQKITDSFLSEDETDIKSYILLEVVIPTVKRTLSEVLDMKLYGKVRSGDRNSRSSKVSYRQYYDRENDKDGRGRHSYLRDYYIDSIILDNRGEAEEVLFRMDDLIASYDVVSVADLNDLIGRTGKYTDNKYGWTDLRAAQVVRTRDGYLIKLPKTKPLN